MARTTDACGVDGWRGKGEPADRVSLLGNDGAFVEMHAVDPRTDPPGQHVARVGIDEDGATDYRCACLLAECVGIELDDG